MVLVVSTGMPAYLIPVEMVGHVSIVVTRTDVAAQVDTQVPNVNTELEIFESMLEEGLVSQMKMDCGITVIPTLKLQHMIIWETLFANVPMMTVVTKAQNGMSGLTLVLEHGKGSQ